jgi:hypothetical protein
VLGDMGLPITFISFDDAWTVATASWFVSFQNCSTRWIGALKGDVDAGRYRAALQHL